MTEWNLLPFEEATLLSVARDEALLSEEGRAYLPKTPEDAAAFFSARVGAGSYAPGLLDGQDRRRAQGTRRYPQRPRREVTPNAEVSR